MRTAAVPAAALALGAGGCLDTSSDVSPDSGDASTRPEDARDDSGGGYPGERDFSGGDVGSASFLLTEYEGRAVIRRAVEEASLEDTDPCAAPTLAERLNEDQTIEVTGLDGEIVGTAQIDLLAPQDLISESDSCPQRLRQVVGFEFLTAEWGDDELRSGLPDGFTPAERAALAELRASGKAAIEFLDAASFPYTAPGGYGDRSSYRALAEGNLHRAVLELIAELRRDGML